MKNLGDKAKRTMHDTKDKAEEMSDKAKAKMHETKGRIDEKMKQK